MAKKDKAVELNANTEQAKFQAMASVMTGTLLSRLNMFNQAGIQYGTARDVYEALGYNKTPTYNDFMSRYLRQDIAKAVINRPVQATWRGGVQLLEADKNKDEETQLEKAWNDLYKAFGLRSIFVRLDKLSSIGQYGVLLFGLDDVKNKGNLADPVAPGKRKLLYLKPLGEGSATVNTWEERTASPRFGLPKIYDVVFNGPGSQSRSQMQVHHSRILHVAGELLESEVDGVPIMEAILNRLFDVEKVVGCDAETFWRGVRSGYLAKIDKDFQVPEGFTDDLKAQFEEIDHNLRRILVGEGIEDMKALAQQISNEPEKHLDIQIQMISAVTGIPKRILTGSERGELASTDDRNQWRELIQDRREEYAEPNILDAFVERLIQYEILPKPSDEYSWLWKDLWSPSEKEKVEIGKTRAEALKSYASEPLSSEIVPPKAFKRNFLGLSDEEIELIDEMQENSLQQEQDDFSGEEDV